MTARVLKSIDLAVDPDELPEAIKSAIQDAYQQGVADGERNATAQLEHAVESLSRELSGAEATIRNEVRDSVRSDGQTIAHLGADLAGWFMDAAIEADPTVLASSMAKALDAIADNADLTLFLHPDVVAALGSQLVNIPIETDESLGRADYRIVADGTTIERIWSEAIDNLEPELAVACMDSGHD